MDATLITAWKALCQLLEPAFGGPTFVTFLHITTGWVLCRSKPAVTNLVCTIGGSLLGHAARHWTVYERFFYRAVWSLEYVSQRLLAHVVAPLVKRCATGAVIELAIDDTTHQRHGKHVAYAGYFKDASASNTVGTVVHWARNWVVACVSMRAKRWPNWVIGLPVLFALYRKRADCDQRHAFATHQEITAGMIRFVRETLPDWVIRIAADGAYATRTVVDAASADGRRSEPWRSTGLRRWSRRKPPTPGPTPPPLAESNFLSVDLSNPATSTRTRRSPSSLWCSRCQAARRGRRSVVIGPQRLNQKVGDAPHALEYGGTSTVVEGLRSRRTKRRIKIAARPFMGPAFEREKPKLPAMWADSVKA